MREVRIVTVPFEFISIQAVECLKCLNEHGVITIKGIVSQENAREYQMLALDETWVTVKLIDEDGGEQIFFNGILTEMHIEKEGRVDTLSFTAKTGSYLLDLAGHIRTYQKESYTYDQMLRDCLSPDSGEYIMLDKQGETVGNFFVQYKESDWEFIKRLAAYAKTVLIPEDVVAGRKVYFGYRSLAQTESVEADSYKIIQDYGDYKKREAEMPDIAEEDMLVYEMVSREIYGLGNPVIFQGRELVIGKIASRLVGHELIHTYTLHSKSWGYRRGNTNAKIAGISLKAHVTGVDKTKVLVQVAEDENQGNSGYRWFDFATVYSSPDGTGWYCMPENGDKVRVVFPDQCEKKAYVVSCVHVTDAGRKNPNEKSWKNKQQKEILFTPDTLIMRNNNGMSIEISDNEGIKIISDKKIMLQADNDICINSESGVQVSASDQMLLNQGGAVIQMSDAIVIGGGKIYMN